MEKLAIPSYSAREVKHLLIEIDNHLYTMLYALMRSSIFIEKALLSVLDKEIKQGVIKSTKQDYLEVIAQLFNLYSEKHKRKKIPLITVRNTVDLILTKVPRGIIDDVLDTFVSKGAEYLKWYKRWEYQSSLCIDEQLWERIVPEDKLLAHEEVIECSDKMAKVEREWGCRRAILPSVIHNITQLSQVYKVKVNNILNSYLPKGIKEIRKFKKNLSTTEVVSLASQACLYAYRTSKGKPLKPLGAVIKVKAKEVLHLYLTKSGMLLDSENMLEFDEEVLSTGVHVLENDLISNERQEMIDLILTYIKKLDIVSQKLLALRYGVWSPLLMQAKASDAKDSVPELLRQYVAKYRYAK